MHRPSEWPGPLYREISYREACALARRELPRTERYAVVADVRVECATCHREYEVPAFSSVAVRCPYCFSAMIYKPQLALDLDPRRDAAEAWRRELLAWPPIATREDWQMRNGLAG